MIKGLFYKPKVAGSRPVEVNFEIYLILSAAHPLTEMSIRNREIMFLL
jgi:hypothetical protein